MKSLHIEKMIVSALCLALAFFLPFLTGQIPKVGNMLLPMHIPVLLCGFLCGSFWGFFVGFVAPLLRSLIFSVPPLIPTAVCMALELATYGTFAGIFHGLFRRMGIVGFYLSLALTMLVGRLVWGITSYAINLFILNKTFTLPLFFADAFVSAWPGILLQFLLIPLIITGLQKSHFHLVEDKL